MQIVVIIYLFSCGTFNITGLFRPSTALRVVTVLGPIASFVRHCPGRLKRSVRHFQLPIWTAQSCQKRGTIFPLFFHPISAAFAGSWVDGPVKTRQGIYVIRNRLCKMTYLYSEAIICIRYLVQHARTDILNPFKFYMNHHESSIDMFPSKHPPKGPPNRVGEYVMCI